jgi:streptogramin lyase
MSRAIWTAFCLCGLALACSDRQRQNPLDPAVEDPQSGLVSPLAALALDGRVELRWDFSRFSDIEGYRLYRRQVGREFGPITELLPPETTEYADATVQNGISYEYRLSLMVEGEGERFTEEVRRVTPGTELVWVADRNNGLVWKISADARSAHFARGRFRDLADIAIDRDGACWVSDRGFAGLYRIDPEGELTSFAAVVERPGELEIDAEAHIGWLADLGRRRVFWFSLAATDSLELFVVDASFANPSGLAVQNGGCWIADQSQNRAMFYQIDGTRQVEFNSLEAPSTLAAGGEGEAWILVDEGRGVLRLDRFGNIQGVDLPFAQAVRLSVDRNTGACWVLGELDIAVFSAEGMLERHWTIEFGSGLFFDARHRRVWIATGDALWKFTDEGENIARLDGFGSIVRIAVDPGN